MDGRREPPTLRGFAAASTGLYVYCVADGGEAVILGSIGIDGASVHCIPHRGLCAVVHHCPAMPYASDRAEQVTGWVRAHHRTIQSAQERFAAVVPLTFNTILLAREVDGRELSAEQGLLDWVEREHERLSQTLDRVRDRVEYGVQVFCDPEELASRAVAHTAELGIMKAKLDGSSAGTAFLLEQKLRRNLAARVDEDAAARAERFLDRIRRHAQDLSVASCEPQDGGRRMVLNLSCLVARAQAATLLEELDTLGASDGTDVRITGPWPAYSFV